MKWIRALTTILLWLRLLPVLALALVWFVELRPTALGGKATYILVAGESMLPTLHPGDLVVLKERESYELGEIAAFVAEGGVVIHRIVGRDGHGYVMKGDNKELTDPWLPTDREMVGSMLLRVPRVGYVLGLVRQPPVFALLCGLLALLFLKDWLWADRGKRGEASAPGDVTRRA